MEAIGYTRVPTDEQGRSCLGLAAQRRTIEDRALTYPRDLLCAERSVRNVVEPFDGSR